MGHHLEKHPTLPIVMRTYDSSFTMSAIDPAIGDEDKAMIDAQGKPVYYLADLRNIQMSFEEIVRASNLAAGQEKTYKNPNVIENLVIVPNRIVEMAAQGLNTPIFGNLKIKTFRTPEEAIAYVQQKTHHS